MRVNNGSSMMAVVKLKLLNVNLCAGFLLLFSIGAQGQAQLPVNANYLGRFEGDFAPVMVAGKKQFLHSSGKVLVDKTETIGLYGIVVGVKHDAYGAINRSGKVIAPFKYDEVRLLSKKEQEHPEEDYCFIVTRLDGKSGAIDSTGRIIAAALYSSIESLTPNLIKVRKDGLWGWTDLRTGKIIQAPKYEEVTKSYVLDHLLEIADHGLVGLALEDGTVIAAPKYKRFSTLNYKGDLLSYTTTDGQCGLMDKTGKELVPAVYDDFNPGPAPDIIGAVKEGKVGLINRKGEVLVPFQYTKINAIGNHVVVWKQDQCGLLDETGKELIPTNASEIKIVNQWGEVSTGRVHRKGTLRFLVKKGDKWSLFMEDGHQIKPFEYNEVRVDSLYGKPVFDVFKNQKIGLVDYLDGHVIVPPEFDQILYGDNKGYNYADELASAEQQNYVSVLANDKMGLFDLREKKLVFPARYTRIAWQNSDLLLLKSDDTTALARKNGDIIKGPKLYGFYTVVDPDRIVEVRFEENGHKKTQLTNGAGKVLYENPEWNFEESNYNYLLVPKDKKGKSIGFNSGLLKIDDKKRGNVFVNLNGEEVILSDYSYVGDFYNGLAIAGKGPVVNELNFGIISLDKKVVYPLTADEISPFENDLLDVSKVNLHGLIRKNGSVVFPVIYEKITQFPDLSYFKLYLKDKYGAADSKGKMVLPIVYDDISYNSSYRVFEIEKQGKKGLADLTGKIIVAPVYDELGMNSNGDQPPYPLFVKQGKWYSYLDAQGKPLPFRSEKQKDY